MEVEGNAGHSRGRLGSSQMEEFYGGRKLALVPTMEAHHKNNCSYKEALKQPMVLAQLKTGEEQKGYRDLPTNGVSGAMKAQQTAGPPVDQLEGGSGVRNDENLAEEGVYHTLREMKMQLADLQEKVNSLIRSVEKGTGMGLAWAPQTMAQGKQMMKPSIGTSPPNATI